MDWVVGSLTYSSNSTTNNKGNRRGRNSRNQATNLKDKDSNKVRNLDIEVLVDGSVHGLQSRRGEEIGRAIPSNVLDALELCSNGTKRRGNNGLVESNKEDGEAERRDDKREFCSAGILGLFAGDIVVAD